MYGNYGQQGQSAQQGQAQSATQPTFQDWLRSNNLDSNGGQLQELALTPGYLWHKNYPSYAIRATDLQFYDWQNGLMGTYYLGANRFKKQQPSFPRTFYLAQDNNGKYTNKKLSSEPASGRFVKVMWEHVVEHLYQCCSLKNIKQIHSLFADGTTEDQLLDYLVRSLNDPRNEIQITGGKTVIGWQDDSTKDCVHTFYPKYGSGHPDFFTAPQMCDLCETLGGRT